MLITPHAVTGAAIAAFLTDPLLMTPIILGSHFVLDSIPHWQETLAPYVPTKKTYIRIPIDTLLAITLVWIVAAWQPHRTLPIVIGAIVANIPDLDTLTILAPKLRKGILEKYWDWHCKIQRETASLWGIATQIIVVILGLLGAYIAS